MDTQLETPQNAEGYPDTQTQIQQAPTAVRKTGRPTKRTPEVVDKLVIAFQRGHNDSKACQFAKISRDSFYQWLKEDDDFSDKIADAKDYWALIAGDTVTEILTDPAYKRQIRLRVETAKWVLENDEADKWGKTKTVEGGTVNNTQNNLFLTDGQFKQLIESGQLKNFDPVKLAQGNQVTSMERGEEQGSSMDVHQNPVWGDNSENQDMSGT